MRFLSCALLLVFFVSCSNFNKNSPELIDYVPENTSVLIKTTNFESLKSDLKNNDFLQAFEKAKNLKRLEQKLESIKHFKPINEVLICFSQNSNDSTEFSLITKAHKNLFVTDSLPNYVEESISINSKTIIKSTINKSTLYSTVIDSTFFASSSQTILEKVLTEPEVNSDFKKNYETLGSDNLSIVITPESNLLTSFFAKDSLYFNQFTKYIATDLELSQNEIYFNGITQAKDSTKSLINIFQGTVPQENEIAKVTPSNADGFLSLTFDDYEIFQQNLLKHHPLDSIQDTFGLFSNITEIGAIYQGDKSAIVLNSIDEIATSDALLGEQNIEDIYREVNIYEFSQPTIFKQTYAPFISFDNATKYCILDHYFVFSDTVELLQSIIANYQNKTCLANKTDYAAITEKLSDAASILRVSNSESLENILRKHINNSKIDVSDYKYSAIQFIYDHDFAHVNGIIRKSKGRVSVASISEELNIKLDAAVLNNPQFVTNHVTRQKDIVVQDITNKLYLISNKGKIRWKKQLNGPILGHIEQIDMYKNGRLQLAFATPNRVYVIDRNGNDVKPFPSKFNDEITQPLAVFDYDKRKKYRLLVTQGKHVLMYDAKGKLIKGFKFKSANGTILSTPKHFRIGRKDYITLKTRDKLYILDRTGKTRVKPKQSFNYSSQPVYLYNNTFTTSTKDGSLISVDTKGNINKRNLGLADMHGIATTSKTLVTQSENNLSIKNKTTELDFGNYTKPKIYYLNNKIYVTTTDLQSHKVYLFDSQSKPLPNFPVYGNSLMTLDNIDKDENLEFVTKGDENSVILYQMN